MRAHESPPERWQLEIIADLIEVMPSEWLDTALSNFDFWTEYRDRTSAWINQLEEDMP